MNKTTATARPWKSVPNIGSLPEDYKFALKACNSHDLLVDACTKAYGFLAMGETENAQNVLRQAINATQR